MPDTMTLLAWGFFAAGLVLLLGTFLRHLVRSRRKEEAFRKRVEEERDRFHSLETLMKDISGVVFEASQRAEDKLAALERTLRHAEQRVLKLASLLEEADAQIPDAQHDAEPPPASANLRVVPGRMEPDQGKAAKQRQVFTLADAGNSPAAIAQEVGLNIGEVQLMLSLRNARRALG